MHSTGEHVHILRNAVNKLARAYSLNWRHWNNFLETIGRDYRSRSDSHRASPMPRNNVQGYLTTQRNRVSILLGIKVTERFF